MMRETSSRSSIIFTCTRVLRSIASSARCVRAFVEPPGAEQGGYSAGGVDALAVRDRARRAQCSCRAHEASSRNRSLR
jgi:hypothetical protein